MRPVRSASWRRLVGLLFLLLSAGIVPGCTRASQGSAPKQEPVTLRFGIAIPTHRHSCHRHYALHQQLRQGSHRRNRLGRSRGRPAGHCRKVCDGATDQRALKLSLRPNVKFHDGTPLDREFFRKRLETILKEPQQKGTNVSYQSVTGVELDPDDKDRVVIKLARPEAFLLTDLANSTFPHPTNEQMGTGPYRVETIAAQGETGCI